MRELTKIKIRNFINDFVKWITLALLIFSLSLFWIGFHNVDQAWNLRYVNNKFNVDLVEITFHETYWTEDQVYKIGFTQIIFAFFMFAYSMIMFMKVYNKNDRRKF
jgi:hypothetical protein